MCLSKITESYEPPCPMITDGWKQFGGTDAKPRFQSFTLNGKSDVPLDRWVKAAKDTASDKGIGANDGKYYEAGFHVFANEPSSTKGYRRVFVRNISCRGTDSGQEVIIAQEIFVSSDPNGWPPKGGEDDDEAAGTPQAPPQGGGKGVKSLIDKISGKGGAKAMGITPGQA
jgi:hypothetical protein